MVDKKGRNTCATKRSLKLTKNYLLDRQNALRMLTCHTIFKYRILWNDQINFSFFPSLFLSIFGIQFRLYPNIKIKCAQRVKYLYFRFHWTCGRLLPNPLNFICLFFKWEWTTFCHISGYTTHPSNIAFR